MRKMYVIMVMAIALLGTFSCGCELIAGYDDRRSGLTELAQAGSIYDIELDSTNLYWIEKGDGSVMSVSKLGGERSWLGSALSGEQPFAVSMAIDGMNLYVLIETPNSCLIRMSKSGGVIEELACGLGRASSIAMDEGFIYWAEHCDLWKISKSGGSPIAIADNISFNGVGALSVIGNTAYFSCGDGAIYRQFTNGDGGSTVVRPNGDACCGHITADDSSIYGIWEQGLIKISDSGGNETLIKDIRGYNIAVNLGYVYWVQEDLVQGENAVMKAPKSTLVDGIKIASATRGGQHIAVDESFIYFDNGSSIARDVK